jgi:fructan beta-fructosidase
MAKNTVFLSIIFTVFYLTSLNSCHPTAQISETTNQQQSATNNNTDPFRPKHHFTPPEKWMNDPNGMFYYKGEYHLYYQYYPKDIVWGPMHWGHAKSKDLMTWKHLPIALYPDSLGMIFSGSIVIDSLNTAGFKTGKEAPIVAIFTQHIEIDKKEIQRQSIAYSNDGGLTFVKYTKNPVIDNPGVKDFRDPKVLWHPKLKKWIMVMAEGDHVRFYQSPNLKEWELSGMFGKTEGSQGGVWECPDLFPIKIAETGEEKWILIQSIGNGAANGGSGTQYFVGNFDGNTFKNDNKPETILWLDYGKDNYAGVTFHNAPQKNPLFLGWMSNWQYAQQVPTKSWRSAMTLPRELILKNTETGLRLFQKPITNIKEQTVEFDLKENGKANELGIMLTNEKGDTLSVGYDKIKNSYFVDRTKAGISEFSKDFAGRHYAPRKTKSNILKFTIYEDNTSIEVFADNGETVLTEIFFPNAPLKNRKKYSK